MMEDMAARIRIARLRAAMTQGQLAERIGVTRSAVANWEISTRPKPNITHLVSIAIETNVSFEWIAIGRGDMALKV
ncbi:helix-turn-helix transcriptional regulator [Stenotrophomonas sp.]|jgi:transcriptional regulator with XRE-family HTH domain|uniref:helix-turn-helix transcriptional regulator n=1 Tax=Stenotrophomonas sp. TaxID=69392 RepID=UPI0028A8B297|nr:helix-turn-helix transcriptional regulator [Stenotrophomonas sp.]